MVCEAPDRGSDDHDNAAVNDDTDTYARTHPQSSMGCWAVEFLVCIFDSDVLTDKLFTGDADSDSPMQMIPFFWFWLVNLFASKSFSL